MTGPPDASPAVFPVAEWLDAGRVADVLGIERSTVWRYKHSGRLPADALVGTTPLWHASTVERYRDQLHPRARAARVRKAEREAVRLHGSGGVASGTAATCGECGEPVVFRNGQWEDEGGIVLRNGRWEDDRAPRAHHHGVPPKTP